MEIEKGNAPWKVSDVTEYTVSIRLDRHYVHECVNIVDVNIMSGNLNEEVPNAVKRAELIVRAVNSNDKLVEAAKKLLQAMNQKQFCMEGYRSGGASISEVNAAYDEEHKAYSELFEIVREAKAL